MDSVTSKSEIHKPRILVVENSLSVTGALNSILRSSEVLKDSFHFIFVIPSGSKVAPYLEEKGLEVYALPMKELRKNLWSLIVYLPYLIVNAIRLRSMIRKLKIDLINNNDFYNLLPVVYKLFGGKVPYICYVRFLPSKFPRTLVRLWCALHHRFASKIIAVSQAVRKELKTDLDVVVVGNELPRSGNDHYSPASENLILYPANYIRGKGHEFALESFAVICKKFPAWKLRFVGGDMGLQKNRDFKSWLIERSERLGVSDQVEWLGFTNDLANHYKEASIVLNFSESESFSLTCLEAMFYGRATVATDCGGPAEIIDKDETGLLVPVGNLESMIQAIEFLINHPEKRAQMASKAYESVRIKFSHTNVTERLGRIYKDILKP